MDPTHISGPHRLEPEPAPEPEVAALSAPGRLLDGTWALRQELGRGGMGTVWLADDLQLDRRVAIKMLSAGLRDRPEVVGRFEREARMMAKLEHAHLVPIYAVGRADGLPFIVMKFLEGRTLADHIRQRGQVPLPELVGIARQAGSALDFLHGRGVVHRDIKPQNIVVGPDGHVTVLDLGVAHDVDSQMTKSGMLLGTPAYMSPEQILRGGKSVDHRSDLYAFATVLHEMLTGTPVFQGDSDYSIMRAHIEADPPDVTSLVPDLPAPVGTVLRRALAKRPEERFPSVAEFLERFEQALGSTGSAPGTRPLPAAVRRRPGWAWGAAGLLAAGAGGAAAYLGFREEPPGAPGTVEAPPAPRATAAAAATPAPAAIGQAAAASLAAQPPSTPRPGAGDKTRRVRVISEPSRADIFSGDRRLGATPYDLELAEGTQLEFRLVRAGFHTVTRVISSAEDRVLVRLHRLAARKGSPGNAAARGGAQAEARGVALDDVKGNPFE